MSHRSADPADGKLLKKFDELTDEQLGMKLTAAQDCARPGGTRAAPKGARSWPGRRCRCMNEFAHTMTREMGERIGEARGEVEFSANILAYSAKDAERFLAPVALNLTIVEAHMESQFVNEKLVHIAVLEAPL